MQAKGGFEIVQYPLVPRINMFVTLIDNWPSHFHPAYEIALALHNDSVWLINGRQQLVSEGDLIVLNSNQLHAIHTHDKSGLLVLLLQFSPYFFLNNFPNKGKIKFENLTDAEDRYVKPMKIALIDLAKHYFTKEAFDPLMFMSKFYELLAGVRKHFEHEFIGPRDEQSESAKEARIDRLIKFVEEKFRYNVKLSEFAKEEDVTLSYMSRFIKENFGQSFQEYVTDRRLFYALYLMSQHTDKSIPEISLDSGFSDPRYMEQAFQERLGISSRSYIETSALHDSLFKIENVYPNYDSTAERMSRDDSLQAIEAFRQNYGL